MDCLLFCHCDKAPGPRQPTEGSNCLRLQFLMVEQRQRSHTLTHKKETESKVGMTLGFGHQVPRKATPPNPNLKGPVNGGQVFKHLEPKADILI